MMTIELDWAGPPWPRVGFRTPVTGQASGFPTLSARSSTGLGVLFDFAWQFETASTLSDLHDACLAFVRRLREDGFRPEQVLVALKREITEGGIVHRTPSLCVDSHQADDIDRSRIYERLFGWFLEACFDP
jgi:hypothetical protein